MPPDAAEATPEPAPPPRPGTLAVGAGTALGVFAAGAWGIATYANAGPDPAGAGGAIARLVELGSKLGGAPVLFAAVAAALFGLLGGALAARRGSAWHGALAGFAAFMLIALVVFLFLYLPVALLDGPGGIRTLLDDALSIGACVGLPAAIGGIVAGAWTRDAAAR